MARDAEQERRVQEIVERLIRHRLEASLVRVEKSLVSWRKGELDALAVHTEVLSHASRVNSLSLRIARAGLEAFDGPLRAAHALGLIAEDEFIELTGKHPDEVDVPLALDDDTFVQPVPELPDKRTVMEKLLVDGPVLLHVDARREGAQVPPGYANDPRMVLRIGYNLTPAIPDLVIDQDGVRATLTFKGTPFPCVLPWPTIYAVLSEDSRGMLWPVDVPPEAARDFRQSARSGDEPRKDPKAKRKDTRSRHLRLVE